MAVVGTTTPVRSLRTWGALVVAVLGLATVPVLAAAPAASAAVPATPAVPAAIDAYASYQGQTLCSPTPKVGAVRLAALLRTTYGSFSVGISRACSIGGTSEHKEGRALDWMVSARVPAQKAKAVSFLTWLLAPGADGRPGGMARRLGVMYIGWNDHFWASYRPDAGWTDLKGCSTDPAKRATSYDTYCHRNHVHLSLSWEGASGLTSFWSHVALPGPCEVGWGQPVALPAGEGRDLVPVTPVRAADTRSGAGLGQPCRLTAPSGWDGSHRDLLVHVTGIGDVPAEGVAAVALRITTYRSVLPATVSVRTTAASPLRPVVTTLSGSSYASTTVVPVASDGTIRLAVDRASTDVVVEVVGWAPLVAPPPDPGPDPGADPSTPPDPTATAGPLPSPAAPATPTTPSGRTQLSTPVVVYDGTAAPLRAGEARTVRLGGVGPVPATGLTGMAVTLTAARTLVPTTVGVLTSSLRSTVGSLRTSTLVARSTQLVAPGPDGTVVLRNSGATPAVVRLVANAWFTAGPVDGGGSVTSLPEPVRVVDSGARLGLSGAVTSSAWRTTVLPAGLVPAGARGVLLAVSVAGGTTEGTLVVGSRATVAAASFGVRQSAHEVVLLPLRTDGAVSFRTASLGTQVRAWVLGYVS